MAEPARQIRPVESEPKHGPWDEESFVPLLLRWIEGPQGTMKLLEKPLTPEDFLDPQEGDKWLQGPTHQRVCHNLFDVVHRHLHGEENVVVLSDSQLVFGPGLHKPAPDLYVVRDVRDPDISNMTSFDVVAQGAIPCLVIEVLSPGNRRIRGADVKDKKRLYERVGIPEYLQMDPPPKGSRRPFGLRGFRLGPKGRYRKIVPDREGRLLLETVGLRFGVCAETNQVEVFADRTGERLLIALEIEEKAAQEAEARKLAEAKATREAKARRVAEERAAREARARRTAENELARLRAEIERLRSSGA